MSNFPSISSGSHPAAHLGASQALQNKEKDGAAGLKGGRAETLTAKQAFAGHVTQWIRGSSLSKISQAVRQGLHAAVGHLLKQGSLASLVGKAISYMAHATQRTQPPVSVRPEDLGSVDELEKMQATLGGLKNEFNAIHEQNQQNYKLSTQNQGQGAVTKALVSEGYPKEAELRSKVQAQEQKVAAFEKRLSEQKHVPAFPIRPRPPVRPKALQDVSVHRQIPTKMESRPSASEKMSVGGSPLAGARVQPDFRQQALHDAADIPGPPPEEDEDIPPPPPQDEDIPPPPPQDEPGFGYKSDAAEYATFTLPSPVEEKNSAPATGTAATSKEINTRFDFSAFKSGGNARTAGTSRMGSMR